MRNDKDLSRSSIKDNSRIPKPVSGKKADVKDQGNSTNSRNLRSNSRTTPSLRSIRINRDCLKGIPDTQDRVIKRNRPFTQKVKSTGSSLSPNTSAVKHRAPVPRITTHSCVKPVISITTTQIPKSTRVLRSAVPKSTYVHSSKTDASALAKISTTTNASSPASTRILRSHVSSSRDPKAVTASAKSKIPKFSWNLRSRPSLSECKTKESKETQPLLKRGPLIKVAETTSLGKRLAVGEDLDGDLCSKLKKQEPESSETKTKLKESNKLLELRPEQLGKKADVDFRTEQIRQQDLNGLTKPGVEKPEIKILVVPQEKSIAIAKHEVEEGQHVDPQLDEQQPCIQKSNQELENSGITTALVAEPPVKEQHLEESPLTPEDSEVKILGTLSKVQETNPSVQVFTAVLPLAKDSLGDPVTLAKVVTVKALEITSTPLANEVPEKLHIEVNDGTIKSAKAFEVIETALPKDIQPSTVEQAIPAISEEKPASAIKRKSEESDNISAVKPRLNEEITLKTPEVRSQNCRDEPSVIIASPASPSGNETTLTTSADTAKKGTLVEADQFPDTKPDTSSESLKGEPATVVREEQSISETPSKCSKPINVLHEETSDAEKQRQATLLPKDQSLDEPKTCTSRFAAKRLTSLTSEDSEILTKKRRGLCSENEQEKRRPLLDGFCSPQKMDVVGSVVPAAVNQAMEVETSENVASTLVFNLIPAALNIPLPGFSTQFNAPSAGNDMEVSNPECGESIIEDMEMSQSGTNLPPPFAFINIHQLPTPIFGGQPFGQRAAQPSFGLNQPANLQLFGFGNAQVPRSNIGNSSGNVQTPPSLPTGVLNKTGNPVFSFGTQQTNQVSPMSGVSLKQNSPHNVPTRNTQPALVNADGTRRKFLSANRYRRRNVAKPGLQAISQTRPLVSANSSQLGPRQVFSGFSTVTPSPTPMESENGSNINVFLGNQPPNVLNMQNSQFVGQNKQVIFGNVQSSLGQTLNDHAMEEIVQTTPSLMLGNGICLQLNTCFASSSLTTQAGTVVQRALRLPQRAFTTTVGIPPPPSLPLQQPSRLPLPSSVIARKSFPTNIPRKTSTNILRETTTNILRETSTITSRVTSTNVSREGILCKLESQAGELQQRDNLPGSTLNKIYSSTSSLSSSSSTDSDCESEIDALIEGLAESVSNCSLDNCPELDEIGKLIEKFKTLSITNASLDAVVDG